MAADNNLYGNAKKDIEELLQNDAPTDGNLLVYLDAPSESADPEPVLYRMETGRLLPAVRYPAHNSASGAALRKVLDDAVALFPAASYGLILWSHGTGWLPERLFDALTQQLPAPAAFAPLLKSFGKDHGAEMSISELADALPVKFEYIIFDACLMSSIEVLYQLRHKANIVVASPSETLVDGFPYNEIMPFLFSPAIHYTDIAQRYMDYYKRKSGISRSATVAVVDLSQLEVLAAALRSLAEAGETVRRVTASAQIQPYDRLTPSVFYDLQDCMEYAMPGADLVGHLAKAVIYNDYTPYFLNEYAITRSCGLSVYISSGNETLDSSYQSLDWYRESQLFLAAAEN
jgi:hypothetical protein